MKKVFDAWPYGKFIEIQSSLRKKNQGSTFLGNSFINGGNVRDPVQFKLERLLF